MKDTLEFAGGKKEHDDEMYDWNGLSGGTLPGRNAEGNKACGLARAVMRPHDEASTNGT